MRPRSPRPLSAPVLSRGHRFPLPLLLGLLLLTTAAPGSAVAQEGGTPKGGSAKEKEKEKEKGRKGKKEKKETPKKKSAEQVLLEALGAAWRKGDAEALAARFPEKRKVALRLPGSDAGDYRAEQARSLLEEYFEKRSFTKVELKSVKETAGTFAVEYVRSSDRKTVKAKLLLVVGTEKERRVFVSARESP